MPTFTLNGHATTVEVPEDTPLLWVLREELGMTGTKFGCGMGLCGACTVHVAGVATRSCITPAAACQGAEVATIESLGQTGTHPVQQAWMEHNVVQCGYCQSGQIMAAVALLKTTPEPTDAEIDATMSGNICRCGTYGRIRTAIHAAAARMKGAR